MTARRPVPGEVLVSQSGRVRATAPPPGGRYWRVTKLDAEGTRIGQTTGGLTRETALSRIRDEDRKLAAHAPAGAHATRGEELLDHYLDDSRPKNQSRPGRPAHWSLTYRDQNRHLVNDYLRPVLGSVPLARWSAEHAYAVLDRGPTNYMVSKVRRTLSAVLGVGFANGFLRADQRDLHKVTVPLRAETRPPRRAAFREADVATLLVPDEVPSVRQVSALSQAAPPGMPAHLWEGAVYTLAYVGLRVGELLALARDCALGDLPEGLMAVRWQLVEPVGGPKLLVPPKNGYARLVAVCERTPSGFPLREWLTARAEAATTEQAAGHNRFAVLFPTPRGLRWNRSAFRARCFNPAALTAGWDRLEWQGPVRRKVDGRWRTMQTTRHDWRHPPHSLRHHYATTARDLWQWTGAELCLNGGWADEAFVLARYYGSTNQSYRDALAKQNKPTSASEVPAP